MFSLFQNRQSSFITIKLRSGPTRQIHHNFVCGFAWAIILDTVGRDPINFVPVINVENNQSPQFPQDNVTHFPYVSNPINIHRS